MIKTLILKDGTSLTYELRRKQVKNLNLHIQRDGTVWISAGKRHKEKEIEDFLCAKAEWVKKHLSFIKQQRTAPVYSRSEEELEKMVWAFCREIFSYYEGKGISFPEIKFRTMTSQWGNCRPKQRILTFSTNLCFVPKDCVWYVVCHEWTHFFVPNHSRTFYEELSKVCPNWRETRKRLKEVKIP